MEKIILVDGNNLIFRSYFATAYSGNLMKNSKGFPTNALFGFINMINKIVLEEKPTYMIVAFDKGKTFRHEKYKDYKAGRHETPEELKEQMPLAKELLTHMGIKYYECDNYEADDIIGTFADYCNKDENFIGTIISSDRDLLQLISLDIDMKLLKQKDYIRYNLDSFKGEYQIDPIKVIDLKALMGDSSDNIPGVAGIGEKTALRLLQKYHDLNGVYEHLDEQTPKLREKLIRDKENAYMSYELATIKCDIPMEINLEDIKMKPKDHEALNKMYEELEFFSFLTKAKKKENTDISKEVELTIIETVEDIKLTKESAIYLEILGTNYHTSKILGIGIYNDKESYFIPDYLMKQSFSHIKDYIKYTYDLKKLYVAFKWMGLEIEHIEFDTMIAGYLLEYNIKDDIAYLANSVGFSMPFYENVYMKTKKIFKEPGIEEIAANCVNKAKFIYETIDYFKEKLKKEEVEHLFYDIEMPLAIVLGNMEYDGVHIDKNELLEMEQELGIKVELLEQEIYNLAGETFNLASPKQLGEILFEKLELPFGKKNKKGYATSVDILNKLKDHHPIINKILDYRFISKIYTTYVEGLMNTIMEDGKIHTIYTQTLTRTGRLSSIEPNLQNIPIRTEYGRLIRKAFIPSKDSIIISSDYSQIELRILSHMANVESMIHAFQENFDVHAKTASDIFDVDMDLVTSNQRRIAKAVNFGIIYGISSFGLSENIDTTPAKAKQFIEDYMSAYPGIKEYMDKTIQKAHEDGYVKTMLNRKRYIPELENKNYMVRSSGERIALNTPIQGTSADIIKMAMVSIYQEMKKRNLKSKMIIQVHDELVFDVKEEEKEQIIELIRDKMENVITLKVPLKVEIEYGDNWYQAK